MAAVLERVERQVEEHHRSARLQEQRVYAVNELPDPAPAAFTGRLPHAPQHGGAPSEELRVPEKISQDHFDKVVTALRTHDSVSDCLPYSGVAQVPAVLDHLAAEHEKSEGLEWDDVCPAYALAVITHGDYRLPSDNDPMEVLWNEVGGESRLVWLQVKDLVAEAWQWLDAVKSRSEMS